MGKERQRLEIPRPTNEIAAFNKAIIGQPEAVESFAKMLVSLRSGIRPTRPRPLDVKFLAGPSGVGKTEIVYRLAELLGDNPSARDKIIKLNGGEYQSKAEVARLIGAPPGYIGSEDLRFPGGIKPLLGKENLGAHKITFKDNNGQERRVVVILVDEAEKADPAVHHAFLSILDHGNLDLSNNTSADFRDAVIFLTSNIGNQQVEQQRGAIQPEAVVAQNDIPGIFKPTVEEALMRAEARETVNEAFKTAFPPEFRGRIKDVIIFRNLNEDALSKIVDLKIKEVEDEFGQNGVPIKLELDANARTWLIKNGYNPSEGARALEKLVGRSIRDQLVLAHGGIGLAQKTIFVEYDEKTQNLAFYFSETPDLPEFSAPKLSNKARKELLDAFYYRQGQEGTTLDIQMKEFEKVKDMLLKTGEVVSVEVIKKDSEIQNAVKRNLIRAFKEGGISDLVTLFNAFQEEGLIEWSEVRAMPEIKEIARKELMKILGAGEKYDMQIAYILELSGALSREQTDQLFNQLKTHLRDSRH